MIRYEMLLQEKDPVAFYYTQQPIQLCVSYCSFKYYDIILQANLMCVAAMHNNIEIMKKIREIPFIDAAGYTSSTVVEYSDFNLNNENKECLFIITHNKKNGEEEIKCFDSFPITPWMIARLAGEESLYQKFKSEGHELSGQGLGFVQGIESTIAEMKKEKNDEQNNTKNKIN